MPTFNIHFSRPKLPSLHSLAAAFTRRKKKANKNKEADLRAEWDIFERQPRVLLSQTVPVKNPPIFMSALSETKLFEHWSTPSNWGIFSPKTHAEHALLPLSFRLKFPSLKSHRVFLNPADGSCWVRSLWHCVLDQVLHSKSSFNKFISEIQGLHKKFQADPHFMKDNPIDDTIAVLKVLSAKHQHNVTHVLNHEKVFLTLNRFMRKVCAAKLRLDDKVKSPETIGYINNVEKLSTYGSAEEINAFLSCFELHAHEITQSSDSGDYLHDYREHVYQKEHCQHNKSCTCSIMYATSAVHYNILKK